MPAAAPGGVSAIRMKTDARMGDRSDRADAKRTPDFFSGKPCPVTALQSHAVSFQSLLGNDRHLKEIGATMDDGKAWRIDSAGNKANARPNGAVLKLGEMEDVYCQRFSGDMSASLSAETTDGCHFAG